MKYAMVEARATWEYSSPRPPSAGGILDFLGQLASSVSLLGRFFDA